jgi:hypothetical protein
LMILGHDLLFNKKPNKQFLKRLGVMTLIFLGLVMLIMAPFFSGILAGKYIFTAVSNQSSLYSADLLGFFTPNALNLFFGKFTRGIIFHFSTSGIESVVYIGYAVFALSLFATIKLWKRVKFWLIGALVFMILSLGPTLHVFGISSFSHLQVTFPLPEFLLLYIVPFFRAPARFIPMAMLCLAVLSAITLKNLNNWFSKFKLQKVIGLLFLVIISTSFLVEVNMLPFPVFENTRVPTFYADLSKMNDTFSVLDLPQNYEANNRYMYYSTVSEKPLVEGSISRISPNNVQFLKVFPVINLTDRVENGEEVTNGPDIFLYNENITNLVSFQLFNVRYVILHKDMLSFVAFEKMNAYLNDLLGQPVFYDERMVAFNTNVTKLHNFSAFFSNGWWKPENWSGTPTRWMDGRGSVEVLSSSARYYNLSFSAETIINSKLLKVFLNGKEVGSFEISANIFSSISINNLCFKEGVNELLFSSDQTFVPAKLQVNADTRQLSIAFQKVSFSP